MSDYSIKWKINALELWRNKLKKIRSKMLDQNINVFYASADAGNEFCVFLTNLDIEITKLKNEFHYIPNRSINNVLMELEKEFNKMNTIGEVTELTKVYSEIYNELSHQFHNSMIEVAGDSVDMEFGVFQFHMKKDFTWKVTKGKIFISSSPIYIEELL
jgi:flagellar motor switch protein FliM